MEKIISEVKRKRNERDAALIADYEQAMANGSDKTAVYEYLAEKYDFKRAASVYMVINKHYYRENPKRKSKSNKK